MKNLKKIILVVAMLVATVSVFAGTLFRNGKKVLWNGEFHSECNLPANTRIHGWVRISDISDKVVLVYGDVVLDVHGYDFIGIRGEELKIPINIKIDYTIKNNYWYAPCIFQVNEKGIITKIYCDDEDYTAYDDKLCRYFGYSQRGVFTYP